MIDPHQQLVLQLFVRHQARIKGFILSLMSDFAATEDVLQETFLVVQPKSRDIRSRLEFPRLGVSDCTLSGHESAFTAEELRHESI